MGASATSRATDATHRGVQDVPGSYTFASWLLLIAGVLHIMVGGIAVWESDWVVAQLAFGNLEAWGWTFVLWGALQVAGGGMSLAQRTHGPLIGIILAGFSMVLWFVFIFAAPYAAIAGIALNGVILHGLTRVESRID
jgi:hypothetical protein